MTYQQSVFKCYHSGNHFSEFLPTRWRQKSTGIDMKQNYVTVTPCLCEFTVNFMFLQTDITTVSLGVTHTHPFNGPFPGLPRWAGTRNVKPIWILLKQETVGGSGISWAICKSAPRSRQITTRTPHHSLFLQAGCPSCRPTNRVKALKELVNRKRSSQEWFTMGIMAVTE